MTGSGIDGMTNAIDGAANVLVLSASHHPPARETCAGLLEAVDTAIVVSCMDSPDRWVDDYRESMDAPTETLHVVDVGGSPRTPSTASDDSGPAEGVSVERVDSPANLTAVGVAITEWLETVEPAAGEETKAFALCFRQLSPFYQFSDERTIFKFLHVLAGHVASRGGIGHYHLDPDVVDDRTLAQLRQLIDAVVEFTDEGDWTVSSR